ncbi:MAG: hypothetical protein WBB01_15645 [Phormidesmis sp.]
MANSSPDSQVRYVTNAAGDPTDVLVPLALWEQLISVLQDPVSGLVWVDEHEPNTQLLADLKELLRQAAKGQTFPISQLWESMEIW